MAQLAPITTEMAFLSGKGKSTLEVSPDKVPQSQVGDTVYSAEDQVDVLACKMVGELAWCEQTFVESCDFSQAVLNVLHRGWLFATGRTLPPSEE